MSGRCNGYPGILNAIVAADQAHAGGAQVLDVRDEAMATRTVTHDRDVVVNDLLDQTAESRLVDAR